MRRTMAFALLWAALVVVPFAFAQGGAPAEGEAQPAEAGGAAAPAEGAAAKAAPAQPDLMSLAAITNYPCTVQAYTVFWNTLWEISKAAGCPQEKFYATPAQPHINVGGYWYSTGYLPSGAMVVQSDQYMTGRYWPAAILVMCDADNAVDFAEAVLANVKKSRPETTRPSSVQFAQKSVQTASGPQGISELYITIKFPVYPRPQTSGRVMGPGMGGPFFADPDLYLRAQDQQKVMSICITSYTQKPSKKIWEFLDKYPAGTSDNAGGGQPAGGVPGMMGPGGMMPR
jgi:hypothetical protein